jgi:alkylation response protein AidB-like acyl-CoA dehydrogenase
VESVHRFSRDVLRPLGQELDTMSAAEVIAESSPLWGMYPAYAELGIDPATLAAMEPAAAARMQALIFEELGWGDAGLALSLMVAGFPGEVAQASGNRDLVELCEGKLGCWPVTQPDTGSDVIDTQGTERHPGAAAHKGNIVARFDGDEIVISGQTSAWVSNGTIAQVGALCCPANYGDGIIGDDGNPNRAVILVPLDGPEVSRGKPLEKLGQVSLPQGEIFFDDLRIPRSYAVAQEDAGAAGFLSLLAEAGVGMSQVFTGLARAAFEHALSYAHERKQGGVELVQHQTVRYRLGEMYKKVEACRAMTRRAGHYLRTAPAPHPTVSSTSKVFVTQTAFEVANEALQMLGGNGLTKEYPTEKLLRDARSSLIEDGENFFLTLRLGTTVCALYQAGWAGD